MGPVPVVEFPAPVTVSGEGPRAKRDTFDYGDAEVADEHPCWVLRTDRKDNEWDPDLPSNRIVCNKLAEIPHENDYQREDQ